jgi:enamine deaminase RidA (YjgF/YER057c/UK114 family)
MSARAAEWLANRRASVFAIGNLLPAEDEFMSIERRDPPGMSFTGMAQAVKAAGWIHVSGQVALRDGAVVGIGDPAAQAAQCFANITAALAAAGARPEQVVKLNCYLTDKAAYGGYAEVRNRLFAAQPPASTVVIVKELLMPELLMEIEAVAWTG